MENKDEKSPEEVVEIKENESHDQVQAQDAPKETNTEPKKQDQGKLAYEQSKEKEVEQTKEKANNEQGNGQTLQMEKTDDIVYE